MCLEYFIPRVWFPVPQSHSHRPARPSTSQEPPSGLTAPPPPISPPRAYNVGPSLVLGGGRYSRSKRAQRRAAGDPWGGFAPVTRAGGKPGGTRGWIPRGAATVWDHKLVKATAGLVISGAWSSTPGVVGANGDRRRGLHGTVVIRPPNENGRPASRDRLRRPICLFAVPREPGAGDAVQ